MSTEKHIHITTEATTGLITLDRPKALNALSLDMCGQIKTALMGWVDDAAIDRVMITATPGRAFCAGGDVRSIAPMITADISNGDHYFQTEYSLDLLIAVYPKPVFVIADGLTMGGGAGILLNASHPVITTAMDFAMPETAIGLFPDVGAARFLRQAPHPLGVMMAMTGWRIGAGDMLAAGIAPLCIESDAAAAAMRAIITATDPDAAVAAIKAMAVSPDDTPLLDAAEWISGHFGKDDVMAIRQGLEGDDHPMAEKLRFALDTRCPMSIHLSHRLMSDPALAPADKVAALEQDYRIAWRMIRHPDFIEGVRALLIDKDNAPVWQPGDLTGVTRAMVDAMITPENAPRLDCPEAEAMMEQ